MKTDAIAGAFLWDNDFQVRHMTRCTYVDSPVNGIYGHIMRGNNVENVRNFGHGSPCIGNNIVLPADNAVFDSAGTQDQYSNRIYDNLIVAYNTIYKVDEPGIFLGEQGHNVTHGMAIVQNLIEMFITN